MINGGGCGPSSMSAQGEFPPPPPPRGPPPPQPPPTPPHPTSYTQGGKENLGRWAAGDRGWGLAQPQHLPGANPPSPTPRREEDDQRGWVWPIFNVRAGGVPPPTPTPRPRGSAPARSLPTSGLQPPGGGAALCARRKLELYLRSYRIACSLLCVGFSLTDAAAGRGQTPPPASTGPGSGARALGPGLWGASTVRKRPRPGPRPRTARAGPWPRVACRRVAGAEPPPPTHTHTWSLPPGGDGGGGLG